MPAGTIKLTNNSVAVTGTGTAFDTELKANDFLVAIVGGTTYTLAVKSVESATALTLITAYGGATTSGLAWSPVPNATLVGITAQVAADVAKAIRGLNLDKNNWQQIFSASGTVTVTLPDGSSYTGPAWSTIISSVDEKVNTVADSVAGKMDKSKNLSDVDNVATARSNLALGNAAVRDIGTSSGTVASGGDIRLSTVDGKSGGQINGPVVINNLSSDATSSTNSGILLLGADANYHVYLQYVLANGQYHAFRIVQNGNVSFRANSNGSCYAASFNPLSDSRLKADKQKIPDALAKVESLSGYTFNLFGERKTGGIAQEIQKVLPEAITESYSDFTLEDGTIVKNALAVDYGSTFGLIVEAIKELSAKVSQRDAVIEELQKRLKAVDGLDA